MWTTRIWGGVVLTGLSAALLTGCNEAKTEAQSDTPRPVLVMAASFEKPVIARSFTAAIRPRIESGFGFRIPGKVVRRLVENGQLVAAGDILAELDDSDLRLQLRQTQAEAQAAASSQVQADAELRRALDLQRRGFAAEASVDRARALADEARGRTERARQAVELAQNNLEYTQLRADAAGVVTAVTVEPGTVLAAGQVAFRVAQTAEREAEAAIPEALLQTARNGTASVTLWSQGNRSFPAQLRELSATADPLTRTYLARFSVADLPATVRLGMSATLTLSERQPEALIRLPLAAMRNVGAGPTVWVVQGDKVTKRSVDVARIDGASVFVRGGLQEGEKVVRMGVHALDPNRTVRVVERFAY